MSSEWAGRRVTVVGLGRSGLAAATLLCRAGARVSVTEAGDNPVLRASADALRGLGLHRAELGRHTAPMIEGADLVIASPGVPDTDGPLAWASARGIPVISEVELAWRFCPSPVVGVTGTNGKSTVVTLIAEIAKAAGRPAVACGNLGYPFSAALEHLTPESLAVVEVSSFQLLCCERFRPSIGVLLNIGSNHLDRHGDLAAYLAAKARLFQRQTQEDWAVVNGADPAIVSISGRLRARRVWFGDNRSNAAQFRIAPQTERVLTPNLQAVLQVARLLGVPDPLAWQVIRSFRGLEHRLEHLRTVRGVRFVNDSKSTSPDSTLYALTQTPGEVVVIVGGRDKGSKFEPLFARLDDPRVRGIILMGESRRRLRLLLNGSTRVREADSLPAAVDAASRLAGPGSTVLFSPACASFDMFRDFEDRGRAFKSLILKLDQGSGIRDQGSRQPPTPNPEPRTAR